MNQYKSIVVIQQVYMTITLMVTLYNKVSLVD